ncbi:MAG: sulfatase-like hydrolase/transferase [Verrucomicrobiota bacterium]
MPQPSPRSRRRFLYLILKLFITSLLVASPKSPNIIMFLIDDQDFDQLATYGGETYTPNLDRLAAEGIKFNRAYVSSTVCTPSRYSFLTGRYAGASYEQSFIAENPLGDQGHIGFNMGLEDDNMNVGAVLAANGYTTGFVGKYHAHGTESLSEKDFEMGIRRFEKNLKATPENSAILRSNELIYREELMRRGFSWAKHVYPGNMKKPFGHHNPEWTMEAALEFLEENKERPFYLHYCSTLLHGPNGSWLQSMTQPQCTGMGTVEPDPAVIAARQELLEVLEQKGFEPKKHYGIAWIDANLGVMLDKLKELGIDDNTLVVFAPDHGSSDKGSLYGHNGNHIPLLMRWPAGIPAGLESDELVQNIDMVPTFFDLASARVPSGYLMHGISLKPLLKDGKAPSGTWRDSLYFEIGAVRAIMTEDWKYISVRYPRDRIEAIKRSKMNNLPRIMNPLNRWGIGLRGLDHPGFWDQDQLYHLSRDEREMNNLAASPEHQPKLQEMQRRLTAMLKTFENRPYGEFVPGGDAVPPGQLEEQFAWVRQLEVRGKKVVIPPELQGLNSRRK